MAVNDGPPYLPAMYPHRMIPKHSSRAGKRLSMDMGCTSAEPAGVLWDMFFPWMSTNLLAESMVMMGWEDCRLSTLWGGK